jgi:hypothetical protein
MLQHSGSTTIKASSVSWGSATLLTATFAIPNTTSAGPWNVVITNPDGQTTGSMGANYFTVREYTTDS